MLGGGKKRKRKRAAISAARDENKATEKSALMSRVCAAGCVGWIPPRPWQGRGGRILLVQTQLGAE